MTIDPGTRIGPYEVKGVLGAGGMGVVYRAHDDRLQRDIALKLLGAGGREQNISWQDYSQLGQLSRDRKQILFSEEGDGAGAGVTAYLRPADGGAPLRLGDGLALALSADGSQALLRVDAPSMHLDLVPIGAGRAERLAAGSLVAVSWAAFVPGVARVLLLAKEEGKRDRLYVQDLPHGDPRPLSDEGVAVSGDAISPDGKLVAVTMGAKVLLLPLDAPAGAPRERQGLAPASQPIAWSQDGAALFIRGERSLPAQIDRYDLASGTSQPWRTLAPVDPAGALEIGRVSLARDGEVYAYESYRLLSDLYVIDHLV